MHTSAQVEMGPGCSFLSASVPDDSITVDLQDYKVFFTFRQAYEGALKHDTPCVCAKCDKQVNHIVLWRLIRLKCTTAY